MVDGPPPHRRGQAPSQSHGPGQGLRARGFGRRALGCVARGGGGGRGPPGTRASWAAKGSTGRRAARGPLGWGCGRACGVGVGPGGGGGGANGTSRHIQHSPNTPTTGLRERRNDTSGSTGRSGRQNAATRRNMRREERVTVQGPVKQQQPDGMSHGGGGNNMCAPPPPPPSPRALHSKRAQGSGVCGFGGGGTGSGMSTPSTLYPSCGGHQVQSPPVTGMPLKGAEEGFVVVPPRAVRPPPRAQVSARGGGGGQGGAWPLVAMGDADTPLDLLSGPTA